MTDIDNKHWCESQNADKFWDWIKNRGGVAVWQSQDLSNPGQSWSTPALTKEGTPYPKPHPWKTKDAPDRVITDPEDILVSEDIEVKRFRIKLEQRGLKIVVSDAGSARIRREIAQANDRCFLREGAFNRFDYATQEAVILAPIKVIGLTDWAKQNGKT
jgi:hypothetical protein